MDKDLESRLDLLEKTILKTQAEMERVANLAVRTNANMFINMTDRIIKENKRLMHFPIFLWFCLTFAAALKVIFVFIK